MQSVLVRSIVVAGVLVAIVVTAKWILGPAAEIEKLQQFFDTQNKSFVYYGQLKDQSGQPIESARVTGLVTVYGLQADAEFERRELVTVESDASGRFELRAKGAGVRLVIEHRDYRFAADESLNVSLRYEQSDDLAKLGTAAMPATVIGWSAAELPPETNLNNGEGRASFEPDGEFHPIRLGRTGITLEVAISRDENSTFERPGAWAATIRLPKGSIQPAKPGAHVKAPVDGYRDLWFGNFDGSMPDWSYRLSHSFYFRADAPVRYGSLDIEWTAFWNVHGDAAVRAKYRVNTSGGQLLMSTSDFP